MNKVKSDSKPISCAIFGMGRMGRSLFLTLNNHSVAVSDIYSRSNPDKSDLTAFFKNLKTKNTQILFLAVPDDAIENIAKKLTTEPWLPPHIAHLSGAVSFDILKDLQNCQSTTQFHPLASLDGQHPIPAGTLNAIASSTTEASQIFSSLSKQIALEPFVLQNGTQALYHTAASFAGNLPVALVSEAIGMLKQINVDESLARKGLANLLRSTANAIEQQPLEQALTGPVARGDFKTIAKHLAALKDNKVNDKTETIYRLLSLQLLNHAKHKHVKEIKKLLS